MSPSAVPAAGSDAATLSISFNAESTGRDAGGFFKAENRGFTAGAPELGLKAPLAGPQSISRNSLPADFKLYVVIYETSGSAGRDSATVWFETVAGASPLAEAFPTKESPWAVAFSEMDDQSLGANAIYAPVGSDGFKIEASHAETWEFSVVIRATAGGQVKLFKAGAKATLLIPEALESTNVGVESPANPKSE